MTQRPTRHDRTYSFPPVTTSIPSRVHSPFESLASSPEESADGGSESEAASTPGTHTPLYTEGLGPDQRFSRRKRKHKFARRPTMYIPPHEPDTTPLWGWALLVMSWLIWVSMIYTVFVSKFMPTTGWKILDAIKQDTYYCLLIPTTFITSVYFIMWNWMGMKFFRHN